LIVVMGVVVMVMVVVVVVFGLSGLSAYIEKVAETTAITYRKAAKKATVTGR
jgi:hypothetical protein